MKMRTWAIVPLVLFTTMMLGCTNTNDIKSNKASTSSPTTESTVKLVSSSVTDVSQSQITVKTTIQNSSDKAVSMQPSELALISSSTVLSPSSNSKIPSQIPARSTVQLSVTFDNNGQLVNGIDAKFGFQPDTSQPEQFVSLGKISIKDGSSNSASAVTETSQPKTNNISTSSGPTISLDQSDGSKIAIPLVGLKATYGITQNPAPSVNPTKPLPDVSFDVPSDQAKLLAGYWVNEGDGHGVMFLGPVGWIPTQAGVGADGSESFTLQSPSDITDKLTYAGDGGCAGCAIGDIGTYFPAMKNWASQQGFQPGYQSFISEDQLNANTIAYAADPLRNGYETNGVAHMQTSGEVSFHREEITLPTSQHDLATTILNFFTRTLP